VPGGALIVVDENLHGQSKHAVRADVSLGRGPLRPFVLFVVFLFVGDRRLLDAAQHNLRQFLRPIAAPVVKIVNGPRLNLVTPRLTVLGKERGRFASRRKGSRRSAVQASLCHGAMLIR
jgi:hypothetical protein